MVQNAFCKLQVREWIKLFLTLGTKRKGYANRNVTPYMHSAAYHTQDVLNKFSSVKQFSGQGKECLAVHE